MESSVFRRLLFYSPLAIVSSYHSMKEHINRYQAAGASHPPYEHAGTFFIQQTLHILIYLSTA